MKSTRTKSLSLIVLALCLCLSFNSVASSFVSFTHSMGGNSLLAGNTNDTPSKHVSSKHKHHAVVVSVRDKSETVEHAHPDNHTLSHVCCEDGKEACLSTNSACATHCTASVIDRTVFCLPMIMKTVFIEQTRFKRSLSVDLAGPFKPPR